MFGSEAKTGTYLSKYIQELNRSVFPKEKDKPIEKEVSYNGRDYRAILSKVPVQDLQEAENILQMRKGDVYKRQTQHHRIESAVVRKNRARRNS